MSNTKDLQIKDSVLLPKTNFPMRANLPVKEKEIMKYWDEIKLYERIRKKSFGRKKYILHYGPPYANGPIHIGHSVAEGLKDIFVKTFQISGYDAPLIPGWDCHGLPIEWKVEESYREKNISREKIPVENFISDCRNFANKWIDIQRNGLKRLGICADWEKPYITMDFESEATIAEKFLEIFMKGFVYKGKKPVMWSVVEKTALAEAEIEYEDHKSDAIHVAFDVKKSDVQELVDSSILIWTTTPWTLAANKAIAYNPNFKYSLIRIDELDDDFENKSAYKVTLEKYAGKYCNKNENSVYENMNKENCNEKNCNEKNSNYEKIIIQKESLLNKKIVVGTALLDQTIKSLMIKNYTLIKNFDGDDFKNTICSHPFSNFDLKNFPELKNEFNNFEENLVCNSKNNSSNENHNNYEHDEKNCFCKNNNCCEHNKNQNRFEKDSEFENEIYEFNFDVKMLEADYVTDDVGTGFVHTAPSHGLEDFSLGKKFNLPLENLVNDDGTYVKNLKLFAGDHVYTVTPKVLKILTKTKNLLHVEKIIHSYPHSWRSKTPLIFKLTSQWFVEIEKIRNVALKEIEDVNWFPRKSKNRILGMVSSRPDWCLSRQRVWGVPITLLVHKETGEPLKNENLNKKIIEKIKNEGIEAWHKLTISDLTNDKKIIEEYEKIYDTLDVWFDSACTHEFVLKNNETVSWPADLYLEGSDQHRGWFQSSLIESCLLNEKAPYKNVLTHGFVLDKDGKKMSKSLGNVVSCEDITEKIGADNLRLWIVSSDYSEDLKIGEEIMKRQEDVYRRFRNTLRYLLGAIDDFDSNNSVEYSDLPGLEKYILHKVYELREFHKKCLAEYNLAEFYDELHVFVSSELSSIYFDVRKDSLYCDQKDSQKRLAAQTVMNILFLNLVIYLAPVISFTSEEAWSYYKHREEGSIFEEILPDVNEIWKNEKINKKFSKMKKIRSLVTSAIEEKRNEKLITGSLHAEVDLFLSSEIFNEVINNLNVSNSDLTEFLIVSKVNIFEYNNSNYDNSPEIISKSNNSNKVNSFQKNNLENNLENENLKNNNNFSKLSGINEISVIVKKSDCEKCSRCWKFVEDLNSEKLCKRCEIAFRKMSSNV